MSNVPMTSKGDSQFIERVHAVKGQLLPLAAPIKLMETLVELLPRRITIANVKPLYDVQPIKEEGARRRWLSLSDTPRLLLNFDGPLPSGWTYVEAAFRRSTGRRLAHLVVDGEDAQGTATSARVYLPSNLRGSVREIVYIPEGAKKVELVPFEGKGYFETSEIVFTKTSKVELHLRMLIRVMWLYWRQSGPKGWISGLINIYARGLANVHQNECAKRVEAARPTYTQFLKKKTKQSSIKRWLGRLKLKISSTLRARQPIVGVIIKTRNDSDAVLASVNSVKRIGLPVCILDEKNYNQEASSEPIQKVWKNCVQHFQQNSGVQYFAVLCAGDTLDSNAGEYFFEAISKNIGCACIYFDHDYIDDTEERVSPVFKPEWNHDLFLALDYISGAALYRCDLLLENLILPFEDRGSPEYALTLSSFLQLGASSISRYPEVAFHYALDTESAAVLYGGRRVDMVALSAYLEGRDATFSLNANQTISVVWPIRTPEPLVSIIIPTRDSVRLLRECVESVVKDTTYENWEIIIADNDSKDPETFAYFESLGLDKRISIVRCSGEFNYSRINNQAVLRSKGDILVLLNNDTQVIAPDWLSSLVRHAMRPEVGAVGAKLIYTSGQVQHAGVVLGLGGLAGHAHRFLDRDEPGYCARAIVAQNMSAVTGACLAMRRSTYLEAGGLDEANLAVAYNDVDLCLRIGELGYLIVFEPAALLYHHESVSRGADDSPEKMKRLRLETLYMKKRWSSKIKNDPCYNPNLSPRFEDFSLNVDSI